VPRINNEVDAGGESLGSREPCMAERDRNVINMRCVGRVCPRTAWSPARTTARDIWGALGSRYTRPSLAPQASDGRKEETTHSCLYWENRAGKQFHGLNVMRLFRFPITKDAGGRQVFVEVMNVKLSSGRHIRRYCAWAGRKAL